MYSVHAFQIPFNSMMNKKKMFGHFLIRIYCGFNACAEFILKFIPIVSHTQTQAMKTIFTKEKYHNK